MDPEAPTTTEPTQDVVEVYVEGGASGGAEDTGAASVLLFAGFLFLLAVVFLVVARRVGRARRG